MRNFTYKYVAFAITIIILMSMWSVSANAKGKPFERFTLEIGNYKVYNHRGGAIKIKAIDTNKQLVVISDKLKVKYYNKGQNNTGFTIDTSVENKLVLKINGKVLFTWVGQYIKKHRAWFYQVTKVDGKPIMVYITLPGGKTVALNISEFDKDIERAVKKAKEDIGKEHNLTIEQIDKIVADKTASASNNAVESAVENSIANAISDATANAVANGADQAVADAINAAVADAVAAGISDAALAAGLAAGQAVLDAGGSLAEAHAAGAKAAGQ